jgi:hypothetical protein
VKRVILYGLAGGVLIALLKVLEIMTLVSAGILRRKPDQAAPAEAVTA